MGELNEENYRQWVSEHGDESMRGNSILNSESNLESMDPISSTLTSSFEMQPNPTSSSDDINFSEDESDSVETQKPGSSAGAKWGKFFILGVVGLIALKVAAGLYLLRNKNNAENTIDDKMELE